MIGHNTARRLLERDLPQAALLHGPPSIGKWTLASHLADFHKVARIDRWDVEHGLTIDTVRLVSAYAARAPMGQFKLIVARLDGSSRNALNALLKTLEEPPPRVKFLLLATGKVLPTIASRCTVFELGLLSGPELEQVYKEQGMPASKVRRAASFARGQVDRGYQADNADKHASQVTDLARALMTGDRDLFSTVFEHWDGRSTELLSMLLTESLTQRWNTFTEQDTHGLHTDRPRLWRMVAALSRLPSARPRLAVRAALEGFMAR